MPQPPDFESRDRDIADLGIKVDANRKAINALGEQTAARFAQVDRRFDGIDQRIDGLEQKVDRGFIEMRGKFDQAAAGQQHIADLLGRLIDQQDDK